MKTSKKIMRAVFAAAFCLFASCAAQSGLGGPECILFNATGETLVSVFLSPAGTTLWREQPLDSSVPDGGSCVAAVSNSFVMYWDIYAFSESGNAYAVFETRIAHGEPVVIAGENLMSDPMAAGEAE
jgi:hypothetical protein